MSDATTAAISGGDTAALLDELKIIAGEALQTFGGLTAQQLNWKPAPDEWSVGQCFEHLVVTNRSFYPTMEAIARGERKSNAWERLSPFSGMFGRMVLRALAPGSNRKFKAPRAIRPSSSEVDARIISIFVEHQDEMAAVMSRAADADMKRTVVTSPISRLVTYTLGDAFRIVVAHERRHFEQARRVTQREGFPR